MARLFNGSSEDLTRTSEAIITAALFTMACWFRAANSTAAHGLLMLGVNNDNHYWQMEARGNAAGDPVRFQINDGSGQLDVATSAAFSANTWHSAMAVEGSSTDHRVYLDGGNEGSSATSRSPTVTQTFIGSYRSVGGFMNGRLAWAAFWNVALSADERLAYARGVNPLRIRPTALVACYPIWGVHSPEIDLISGAKSLTVNGTPSKADGPPVEPFGRRYWMGTVPVIEVGGQQQSVADTLSLTEALSKIVQVTKTDTLSLSETLSKEVRRTISESANLTEEHLNQAQKKIAETLSLSEVLTTAIVKLKDVSDTLSLSEELTLQVARQIAETIVATENLSKQVNRTIADSLGLTEDMRPMARKVLADSLSFTESLQKQVSKTVAETLAFTEAFQNSVIKALAESVVLTEALETQLIISSQPSVDFIEMSSAYVLRESVSAYEFREEKPSAYAFIEIP